MLGVGLIHFVAPHFIIQRPNRPIAAPNLDGMVYEAVSAPGAGGITQRGYLVTPDSTQRTRGVLIFIHGIGSGKEAFVDSARDYADAGFASLIYDQRGHGETTGDYITYGFYERHDVAHWVDFLEMRFPDLPIGVWGTSLGGAVALQAMNVEPRLDFGVVSSTFADLREVVHDYQTRYLRGLPLGFLTDHALRRAGRIANFDPAAVQPAEAARRIQQPLLYIHGTNDRRIAIDHGERIFANVASADKTFVRVPGGGHLNTFQVGGEDLAERVLAWLVART